MQGYFFACLMPDCLQTQAKFTDFFPLNSMISTTVTFGKKKDASAHHDYTLNCSGDNTDLGVKPAQLRIHFLFVLEQGLEQQFLLREASL